MTRLRAIDLFAGAGGMSLGFMKTGCFDFVAAIEKEKSAAETYAYNHKGVDVIVEDASKISFIDRIQNIYGDIDIVIGGPPCQGFSNANRQKTSLISNNNQLVQQYVRAIEELQPQAFVLENVKVIESDKHFFFLTETNIDENLVLGIPLRKEKISICVGAEAVSLISGLLCRIETIAKYRMREDGYLLLCKLLKNSQTIIRAEKYIEVKEKILHKIIMQWEEMHNSFWDDSWEKYFIDSKEILMDFICNRLNYEKFFNRLKILVEVQKTVERLYELVNNAVLFEIQNTGNSLIAVTDTFTVKNYLEYKFNFMDYKVMKVVLNAADYGVPQVRERYIMIGIKARLLQNRELLPVVPLLKPESYFTVRDAIEDLENIETSINSNAPPVPRVLEGKSKLAELLCDAPLIHNHIITNSGEEAKERFAVLSQGENFHNLKSELKTTYLLPERTQNTIYLRLPYEQPSGTVMNVRKSMWIHPTLDRALSIREAARLQSFPDHFVFFGPKDSQYQQVGNAVPPFLGQAIAEYLLEKLGIENVSSLDRDIKVGSYKCLQNTNVEAILIERIQSEIEIGLFEDYHHEDNFRNTSTNTMENFIIYKSKILPKKTKVYDTYWDFAAKRQDIFFKRLYGAPKPWSEDPILAQYKFTNAYRASDRVSQYLIKDVIYSTNHNLDDTFFRIILFKLFNKIETWYLLESNLGEITYSNYSFLEYDNLLIDAQMNGKTIYSAAYIMPSGLGAFLHRKKHRNHLQLLEKMMADKLPQKIASQKSMEAVFQILCSYPMIGSFLAYQYCIDINYSHLSNFSEMDFVMPGPGAISGIRKCFSDLGDYDDVEIIRYVAEHQEEEFANRGLKFQNLWGRQLHLIDCQNLFCEVDKYSRIAHPDITGCSKRTKIKQKFTPKEERIDYWYPPKWGINSGIIV